MTSGVDQALPRILMPANGSDRNALRDNQSDAGFDEALGRMSKADTKGDPEAAVEGKPHWLRFGDRLGSAIDRLSAIASKDGVNTEPEVKLGTEPDTTPSEEDAPDVDAAQASRKPQKVNRSDHPDAAIPAETVSAEPQSVPERRIDLKDQADADPIPEEADLSSKGSTSRDMPPAPPTTGQVVAQASASEKTIPAARPAVEPARPAPRSAAAAQGQEIADEPATDEDGVANQRAQDAAASRRNPIPAAAAEDPQKPAASSSQQPARETLAIAVDEPDTKSANGPRDPVGAENRVKVLAQQSFPAPAQSTSAALAQTLSASGALKFSPAAPLVEAAQAQASAGPVHSLSLQLHPAELGMVTASLKFSGTQLTIELQVENADAYRTLTADSESLVKTLKSLGYDVERVTILQPAATNTTQARTDAGTSEAARQGQGSGQPGAGASGNGNAGTGNQQPGSNGSAPHQAGPQRAVGDQDRAGGGVYI